MHAAGKRTIYFSHGRNRIDRPPTDQTVGTMTAQLTRTFGAAGNCTSLVEVVELIAANRSQSLTRRLAAAYGMLLESSLSIGTSSYFEDSRHVVDQLARAKAEIDIAAWHAVDVTEATWLVLAGTQAFLDQQTIGCTEWPTPGELSAVAAKIATDYALGQV